MRRNVLAILAIILLVPSVVVARTTTFSGNWATAAPTTYNEFTVAQLQAEMAGGRLTSVQLTQFYLDRIAALDQAGPNVNSVIELNLDALKLARSADNRRAQGKVIGPPDGLPVVLKDNIDTGDRMQTTAGSFALAGEPAVDDSTVPPNLRAAGAVPISHTQDSIGSHARTVADAAALLNALAARTPDPRDAATSGVPLGWQGTGRARPALPADYTAFVNADGLRGARVGVTRQGIDNAPPQVVAAFDNAIAAIQSAGATTVDLDKAGFTFASADGEFLVLVYDFKIDVQNYFATRVGVPMAGKTLADAIAFNTAHASTEMPYFFQEIFELAQSMDTSGPDPANNPQAPFGGMTYNQALAIDHNAGANGIDAALSQFHLDAVVAPTDSPGWTTDLIMSDHFVFASSGLAGGPGYPIVQVPAANVLGMPMGISFLGTAFSEPTLIKLASGFEATTHARTQPTFTGNITTANTNGTTLQPPKPPKNATGMRPHRI